MAYVEIVEENTSAWMLKPSLGHGINILYFLLYLFVFSKVSSKNICALFYDKKTPLNGKLYPITCSVINFSCSPASLHLRSSHWHLPLKIRSAWRLSAYSWAAEALSGAARWGPPLGEEDLLAPRKVWGSGQGSLPTHSFQSPLPPSTLLLYSRLLLLWMHPVVIIT